MVGALRAAGVRGGPVVVLRGAGRMAMFALEVLVAAVRPPYHLEELVLQLSAISRRCLVPVLAVVTPVGMLLALQGTAVLRPYGTEFLVSGLISVALLRELCPAMTGIMMAAQAGSAMAVELGSMRIKEEIDALETMAVAPLGYLVVPRVLAATIACPMINLVAFGGGLIGGRLIAVGVRGISPGSYTAELFRFTDPSDIVFTTVKALLFGVILSLVGCYRGYRLEGGSAEVGRAANSAVVTAIVVYLVVNYVVTSFFFAVKPWFGY
jgi:phospholipid/cholesterol/gamma-HCH transport system permease protein